MHYAKKKGGRYVMSQTLENTLLLSTVFIVVTIIGVRYVQKQQKRKLLVGFIVGLLIALVGITFIQGVMLSTQFQHRSSATPLSQTLTNEQFLTRLTYAERFGDSLTIQIDDLQQLAKAKDYHSLQIATNEVSTLLKDRIHSINTLIENENLSSQQTNYLLLYKKGLKQYIDATTQFETITETKTIHALPSASKKLSRGLTTIEQAQVIINSMT